MESNQKRITQIEIENKIWILYFFLIGLCLYANENEKKYFTENDQLAKEKYRKLTILIFFIAVFIYSYFLYDNYKDYRDLKPSDSQKITNLSKLSLLASTMIFMSGLIFLYIAIVDENLDIELAFN